MSLTGTITTVESHHIRWNETGEMSEEEWTRISVPKPITPALVPYAEWEFILLPSSSNTSAYHHACSIIKESIFKYCIEHHNEECDLIWDAPCDVNLEFCGTIGIFGHDGIATKHMAPTRIAQFIRAIDNLAQLRHRFAHPSSPSDSCSLQWVCKHISYARTMALLLEDQSAVRELDVLLESLFEEGREVLRVVETYRTCEGLPAGQDWPRNCERIFDRVIGVQIRQDRGEWNRVPEVVRIAAEDWDHKYIAPGRRR